MRITLLTTGSRGDVQPYVALAVGLKRAGHIVRLPVHETYRELIVGQGLDFYPLESENPLDFMRRPAVQAALSNGDHLRVFAIVLREAGPLFEGIFDDFWHNCQDADVVISSMAFFGAYDSARSPTASSPQSTSRRPSPLPWPTARCARGQSDWALPSAPRTAWRGP